MDGEHRALAYEPEARSVSPLRPIVATSPWSNRQNEIGMHTVQLSTKACKVSHKEAPGVLSDRQ